MTAQHTETEKLSAQIARYEALLEGEADFAERRTRALAELVECDAALLEVQFASNVLGHASRAVYDALTLPHELLDGASASGAGRGVPVRIEAQEIPEPPSEVAIEEPSPDTAEEVPPSAPEAFAKEPGPPAEEQQSEPETFTLDAPKEAPALETLLPSAAASEAIAPPAETPAEDAAPLDPHAPPPVLEPARPEPETAPAPPAEEPVQQESPVPRNTVTEEDRQSVLGVLRAKRRMMSESMILNQLRPWKMPRLRAVLSDLYGDALVQSADGGQRWGIV